MKLKHKVNIFIYNLLLTLLNFYSPFTKSIIGNKIYKWDFVFDFDRTFNFNFPINKKFKFIQIGGNDGVSFDTLFEKIINRESKGIILEPSPRYFDQLKSNYKNYKSIILLPYAIFEKNGILELFELNEIGLKNHPSWAAGIGSVDIQHLTKLNVKLEEISKIKVKGITFDYLLESYPEFLDVDYLQIDTEGYDFQILKSINFTKFKVKMVKFEFNNLTINEQNKAISILSDQYDLYRDELDLVCIRKNFKIKCRI